MVIRWSEQKNEMHASFVEFLRPNPPNATGVDATSHAWSGKGSLSFN